MKPYNWIGRYLMLYRNAPDGGAGAGGDGGDAGAGDAPPADVKPADAADTKPILGGEQPGDKPDGGDDKGKADDAGKKADDKGEGDKAKADEKPDPAAVVPEDGVYTFQLPDGVELDATVAEAANPVFKELGITVGQANGLASFFANLRAQEGEAAQKAWADTNASWVKQATEDKAYAEVGHEVAFRMANDALVKYGSPALVKTLVETGLANHPEMVRFAFNAAQATLSDKSDRGSGDGADAAPVENRLYGKTTPTTKKG